MAIVALVIGVVCVGFLIVMISSQYLMQKQFKTVLLNKQCKHCKHLPECAGCWRKSDENGQCKIFQPEEEERAIVVSSDELKEIRKEIVKMGFKVEELDQALETDKQILAEDIERLEKHFFDNPGNNQ